MCSHRIARWAHLNKNKSPPQEIGVIRVYWKNQMSDLSSTLVIPDSALAKEAAQILREYSTDLLINHSMRVYLFAAEQGRQQKLRSFLRSCAMRLWPGTLANTSRKAFSRRYSAALRTSPAPRTAPRSSLSLNALSPVIRAPTSVT